MQDLEDRTVFSAAPRAGVNVVLISDSVVQAQQVRRAVTPGSVAVVYDHATLTMNGLIATLHSISGDRPINHLGIVTHGGIGLLDISKPMVWSSNFLQENAAEFGRLKDTLAPGARIDLYACSVAGNNDGKAFVDGLARATGADVYASDDAVGSGVRGDFDFEYRSGPLIRGNELLRTNRLEAIRDLVLPVDNTPPTVNLSYPDSGSFEIGQTITIQGSATDASGISHVWIQLYKGGSYVGDIRNVAPGTGNISSFNWTIPTTLNGQTLNGTDYKIKWIAWDASPANNVAGDYSTGNLTIHDTTPPTVNLSSPDTGSFNVGQTISIQGSASDVSGISHVWIQLYKGGSYVGDIRNVSPGTGNISSYSWTIPTTLNGQTLSGTDYKIKWIAWDASPVNNAAGDSSTGYLTIQAPDTTPPTVNLSSPDSGSFEIGQTISIQGSASDASGISHVWIQLYKGGNYVGDIRNVSPGTGNITSYSWTIPTTLNGQTLNGTDYKIKWIAWDASPANNVAGDYSTGNLTIHDTTAPTVNLSSPDTGTFAVGQSVNIQGSASDASGISHVWIQLYKGGAYVGDIRNVGPGTGNISSYSWIIPATLNGQTLNGTDYQIKWIAWDASPVNNAAGDLSTGYLTIQAPDTTPPTVNLSSPDTGTFEIGQTISIQGSASDASGISHVWIQLYKGGSYVGDIRNVAPGTGNITSYNWTVPASLNGQTLNGTDYKIKWIAWDASPANNVAGDYSTGNLTIHDTTAPTVNLSSPDTGSFSVGQTISIDGTASDASGISHVWIQLYKGGNYVGDIRNVSPGTGNISSFNWTIPSTLNGQTLSGTDYKIKWIAWDASPANNPAGDLSTGNLTIQAPDTTPPTVNLSYPDTGSFEIGQTISIQGSATDASGISHVWIQLYKGGSYVGDIRNVAPGTGNISSYSWTIPATLNGQTLNGTDYKIKWIAWDASAANNVAGDYSTGNLTIHDTTAPTVNLSAPDSGAFAIGQSVNIQGSASDASGISHVWIQLYKGGNYVGDIRNVSPGTGNITSYNWTIPATLNGQTLSGTDYKIKWIAWDASPANNAAGDLSTGNLTIQAPDTTPPTVNLSYPDTGTFEIGQTISIQGSATDASGISHVWIQLYKGGSYVGDIRNVAPGTGNISSFSWTIPSTLNGQTLNGTDYKIKWIAWDASPANNPAGDYSTGNLTIQPAAALPAPSLTSPSDGASGVAVRPTFSWSAVTGATLYRIVVAKVQGDLPTGSATNGGSSVVINQTTSSTSFAPSSDLDLDQTYYWEVRAGNPTTGAGGIWSSQRSFATVAPPIAAPTLTGPANGVEVPSGLPAFTWTSVAGAELYRIIVATTPNGLPSDPGATTGGASMVFTATTTGTTYIPNLPLAGNQTYYWEVHGGRPGVGGQWSAIAQFTVPGATPPPSGIQVGGFVRVRVNTDVRTGASSTAAESGDPDYLGYAPADTLGAVIEGPVTQDGFVWWRVDYGPGRYTGWTHGDDLIATTVPYLRGIDVSHHQGTINWAQVAGAGIEFAFIKATEHSTFVDDQLGANVAGARAAGLLTGVYHFARPNLVGGDPEADAREEANHFVDTAQNYIGVGYLPPELDLEDGAGLGKAALSQWVRAWADQVAARTAVQPLIYVNASYASNYLEADLNQYGLWIAHYKYSLDQSPSTGIWNSWKFWQYAGGPNPNRPGDQTSIVPGIANSVDGDVFRGTREQLQALVVGADSSPPTMSAVSATPTPVDAGSALTVQWTATDDRNVDHVGLYLYSRNTAVDLRPYGGTDDGGLSVEARNIRGTDTFVWTVPPALPAGAYHVKAVAWDAAGNHSPPGVYSNDFTVHASIAPDAAEFVADVTIPDNTQLRPGDSFTKTWRLRNTGDTTWGAGYLLAFVDGSQLDAATTTGLSTAVPPGGEIDVSVPMKAPTTSGVYQGNWQLRNAAGSAFGPKISVKINVVTTTTQGFYLKFPLAGVEYDTVMINSVFDHSMTKAYAKDGRVVAYDGEVGDRNPKAVGPAVGYQNATGTTFNINGHYRGASAPTYLWYDGHPGYDFYAPMGTKVYAPFGGVVHYPSATPTIPNGAANYHVLEIDHLNGYKSYFLHLSTYPSTHNAVVPEGAVVVQGQYIAQSGDTGAPGAPHLHYELLHQDVPIDPYGWTGPAGADPYGTPTTRNLWLPPTDPPPSRDSAGNSMISAFDTGVLGTRHEYRDWVGDADLNDYYRFVLSSTNSNWKVNLSLTADADADMELLDATGGVLWSGTEAGAQQELHSGEYAAGTYYIRVFPGTAHASANYTLGLEGTPVAATDIAGNTPASAFNLYDLVGSRDFNEWVGPTDTNDYYRFTLPAGTWQYRLLAAGVSAGVVVNLLDNKGASLWSNAGSPNFTSTDNRTLGAGTYYVRVQPNGSAGTQYHLSLTSSAAVADGNRQTLFEKGIFDTPVGKDIRTFVTNFIGGAQAWDNLVAAASDAAHHFDFLSNTTAGLKFGMEADVDAGEVVYLNIASAGWGMSVSYNFAADEWTIARGIEVSIGLAGSVAGDEYLVVPGDPDKHPLRAGLELSGAWDLLGGKAEAKAGIEKGIEITGKLGLTMGPTVSVGIETDLSKTEFLNITEESNLVYGVLDSFGFKYSSWWELLKDKVAGMTSFGRPLLSVLGFNDDPLGLINRGSSDIRVTVTAGSASEASAKVNIGVGLSEGLGVSAGVFAEAFAQTDVVAVPIKEITFPRSALQYPDDVGNDQVTATRLPVLTERVYQLGANDVDVFAIDSAAGQAHRFVVTPGIGGANYFWADIRDAKGNVLQTRAVNDDPAVLTFLAPATGQYYLFVTASGVSSTGDYGASWEPGTPQGTFNNGMAGYSAHGAATLTNSAVGNLGVELTEGASTGFSTPISLSPDKPVLSFAYRITSAGDGDVLVVRVNDQPVWTLPITAEQDGWAFSPSLDLSAFAAERATLGFELISAGAPNAAVIVDNIVVRDSLVVGPRIGVTDASEPVADRRATFPDTLLGAPGPVQRFMLTNAGDAPLVITDLARGGDAADFQIAVVDDLGRNVGGPTYMIPVGAAFALDIRFKPTVSGLRTGTITLTTNSADPADQFVTLVVEGTAPNPGVFTVTTTADNGAGSLRQAIADANTRPGVDIIRFAIGSGHQVIRPLAALPDIVDPVLIDATSQPGYSAQPLIELDGTLAGAADGLVIAAADSTVRGLVINRFAGAGIVIDGPSAANNVIAGNYIGTDDAGSAALGNGKSGVWIRDGASGNIVGTNGDGVDDARERNVISGNDYDGIAIEDPGSDLNVVAGNFIGTNAAGTQAIGGNHFGVRITGGAQANRVGTDGNGKADDAERNVISGNLWDGVFISDPGSDGNVVAGNFIGPDVFGVAALGNNFGVRIDNGAQFNRVGTDADGLADAAERNVISGNRNDGVLLIEAATSNNTIAGNFIGVARDGVRPLGNGWSGVAVNNDASTNTIGGRASGAGNVIAYNGFDGAVILSGTGNAILGNRIFSNGWQGIELKPDGATPNDADDLDTGPNQLQNWPALGSAVLSSGVTTVTGILQSSPNTLYRLEFFANNVTDSAGNVVGQRFLGWKSVTTDGAGQAAFEFVTTDASAGQFISATATDLPAGNTSEFAPAVRVADVVAAQPLAYALDDAGRLVTVNLLSGEVAVIGSTAINLIDLAFDRSGNLFGIDGQSMLYRIDPVTVAATAIGDLGAAVNAIAFAPDGTLFGAGTALCTIDTSTGVGTLVGALNETPTTGGFVVDPFGRLFMSTTTGWLARVDPATGHTVDIGPLGQPRVTSLAVGADGNLYGISDDGQSILAVNPQTGGSTLIGSYAGQGVGVLLGASIPGEAGQQDALSYLRQAYGFVAKGGPRTNALGLHEKHFTDRLGRSFFITPNGAIALLLPTGGSSLVATLDPRVYGNLSLLFRAAVTLAPDDQAQLAKVRATYGFVASGGYKLNALRLNEKSFVDRQGQRHIILPDGTIYRPVAGAAMEFVASVNPLAYDDPRLLFQSIPSLPAADQDHLSRLRAAYGFTSIGTPPGTERRFIDRDANVHVLTSDGSLYRLLPSGARVLIDTLSPMVYDNPKLLSQASIKLPTSDHVQLTELRQTFGFSMKGGDRRNTLQLNEKWIVDRRGRWYVIKPDGSIYRLAGRKLDALVAQVNSVVWDDLALLLGA